MKRILHIVSCMELGGTEAFIMNNYRTIDRTEYQFDFLIFHKKDYPYLKEIEQLGGNIYYAIPPKAENAMKLIKIIVKTIRENGPYDAVHSHVNDDNVWGMIAAKIVGVPVRISHSHSVASLRKKSMVKRVYIKAKKYFAKKCATNLLACSNEAGIELYGAKIFREEGKVIKNGIDVDKFLLVSQGDTDVLRKKFDLESKGPVIGNITRFEKAKNQKFVLEIFNLVLKQYPSAVLILGGVDGGTLSEIKAKIAEMKLNDNVRLIGARADIPICLKLIDVYLFPSLREGLPITVMEIQAAGKCCVLSDIVPKEADMGIGALEYVDLSESSEIWAEKIIEVFENKRYIQADVIKEKFIEKGYDIRVSCSELEKIYSKATLH